MPVISYFNSIKVRLELPGRRRMERELSFQFHKGTIRTLANYAVITSYCKNFNSIKVRLERQPGDVGKGAATLFQFHKGTIRTR